MKFGSCMSFCSVSWWFLAKVSEVVELGPLKWSSCSYSVLGNIKFEN